ncbi:MAG: hypothetical protein HYZ18_11895 [Pseudogulbenkiania sp.]|nr:hypothetical protein [Pseudogulbenkiania sp.]
MYPTLRDVILDKALELGESKGWEAVRLYDVATALGITLDEVRQHYRQKDDLAEAWLDRADAALLAAGADPAIAALPVPQRLTELLMAWLSVLSRHKTVTVGMLGYKAEFGHVHLQAGALLRVSRTVQWLREAARLEASGMARIVEEVGLSSLFLATIGYWLLDRSADLADTRAFLTRQLDCAGRLGCWR